MELEAKGIKHDQEKVRLDLLSPRWIKGVGAVLTYGAKKYSAHNWRQGIAFSRLLGASLRHIFAYLDGEDTDSETGLSHILHASCFIMFLAELEVSDKRSEFDDRYKSNAVSGWGSEMARNNSVPAREPDGISKNGKNCGSDSEREKSLGSRADEGKLNLTVDEWRTRIFAMGSDLLYGSKKDK